MNLENVALEHSGDVLFMLLGAVMVFAMHGGFAFLEVGTVRKNQVNALVKLLPILRSAPWSILLLAMLSPMAFTFTAQRNPS